MKFSKYGLPLLAFTIVAVFLGLGLKNDPRLVPSPLIDKPAPSFALPTLADDQLVLSNSDFAGKVWLLNVWASWCAACKEEHPVLLQMAHQGAMLVGLNYKDTEPQAKAWLESYQDPYQQVIVDADGRTGIDFGVYGVPETFLIDQKGQIRYKHIGPVDQSDVANLLALVEKIKTES